MTDLRIEIARQSSPDVLRAVTSLLSQLTSSGRAITAAELDAMIASPAATLFLAKDGDRIVGMISLAVVQMPTGLRSYLEDLVVDDAVPAARSRHRASAGRARFREEIRGAHDGHDLSPVADGCHPPL